MLFSEVGGALISYLIWACKLSSHLLPLTSITVCPNFFAKVQIIAQRTTGKY